MVDFIFALMLLVPAAWTGIQPVAVPAVAPDEPAAEMPAVTIEVNDDGFVIPDDLPGASSR